MGLLQIRMGHPHTTAGICLDRPVKPPSGRHHPLSISPSQMPRAQHRLHTRHCVQPSYGKLHGELVTILSLTPYECQMSHHAGARNCARNGDIHQVYDEARCLTVRCLSLPCLPNRARSAKIGAFSLPPDWMNHNHAHLPRRPPRSCRLLDAGRLLRDRPRLAGDPAGGGRRGHDALPDGAIAPHDAGAISGVERSVAGASAARRLDPGSRRGRRRAGLHQPGEPARPGHRLDPPSDRGRPLIASRGSARRSWAAAFSTRASSA